MKHEIIKQTTALQSLANAIGADHEELASTLKATVFKGATDAEFISLVVVSSSYELNPILREIYAFPKKGGGIVPVVGIDGWLKIATRHPQFDGMEVELSADGKSATCRIHRKDHSHPTVITEYLDECKRATDPWNSMPRRMLRHKAIMQGIRVAFGVSGIYDEDEARDQGMRDVTPKVPASNPFPKKERTESPSLAEPIDKKPLVYPADKAKNQLDPPVPELNVKTVIEPIPAIVLGYNRREGETKGKPWIVHDIRLEVEGQEITASTFSGSLAEKAIELENKRVLVEYRPGRKAGFYELVSLEEVPA